MFIRSQNVLMNRLVLEGVAYVTEGIDNAMVRSRVQHGDVLLNITGASIGRVAIFNIKNCRANVNQHVCIIRPIKEYLHSQYLSHFIASPEFQAEIARLQNGGTREALTFAQISDFRIPLPPLPEQRRISEVLDRADELRFSRKNALTHLDVLSQTLFQESFGDPSDNASRWEAKTLDVISSKITDGEHLNPNFSNSGMPMVMAGNVLDHLVDFSNCKYVDTESGTNFRKKCNPALGDLLIVSRGATIGRLCLVSTEKEFCLMGSVILVKLNHDLANPTFIRELLKHPSMHSKLYKSSGSSAQQAIYLKDVKNLICQIPPMQLQYAFAKRIEAIENLKIAFRSNLAHLDMLFASLQHRAFRGEL